MRTSESTANIADALVKANELLMNPAKSERVNAGKMNYSFAPLPQILDEVRAVLQVQGLAVVQEAISTNVGVGVATRMFHQSGEWIEFEPLILPAGSDAQSAGSALTYARRYALCAALSIAADEDDDGAKASRKPKASPSKYQGSTTSPAPQGSDTDSTTAVTAGVAAGDRGDTGSIPVPASVAVESVAGDNQSEAASRAEGAHTSDVASDATASGGVPDAYGEGADGTSPLVSIESLTKAVGNRARAISLINDTVGSTYNAKTVLQATEAELHAAMAAHVEQKLAKEPA